MSSPTYTPSTSQPKVPSLSSDASTVARYGELSMPNVEQLVNERLGDHPEDPSTLEGSNRIRTLRDVSRGIFNPNHFEIPAVKLPTPPSMLSNVITAIDPLYAILQAFADSHDPATLADMMATLAQTIQDRFRCLHNYEVKAGRLRDLEAEVKTLREHYQRLLKSRKERGDLLARFVARDEVGLPRTASVEAQASPSVSRRTPTEAIARTLYRLLRVPVVPGAGAQTLRSRSAHERLLLANQRPVIDSASHLPTKPHSTLAAVVSESVQFLKSNTSTRSSGSMAMQAAQRLVDHLNKHLADDHPKEKYAKRRKVCFAEPARVSAPSAMPLPGPSSRPEAVFFRCSTSSSAVTIPRLEQPLADQEIVIDSACHLPSEPSSTLAALQSVLTLPSNTSTSSSGSTSWQASPRILPHEIIKVESDQEMAARFVKFIKRRKAFLTRFAERKAPSSSSRPYEALVRCSTSFASPRILSQIKRIKVKRDQEMAASFVESRKRREAFLTHFARHSATQNGTSSRPDEVLGLVPKMEKYVDQPRTSQTPSKGHIVRLLVKRLYQIRLKNLSEIGHR